MEHREFRRKDQEEEKYKLRSNKKRTPTKLLQYKYTYKEIKSTERKKVRRKVTSKQGTVCLPPMGGGIQQFHRTVSCYKSLRLIIVLHYGSLL